LGAYPTAQASSPRREMGIQKPNVAPPRLYAILTIDVVGRNMVERIVAGTGARERLASCQPLANRDKPIGE
jgi:hypothetical protein